MVLILSDSQDYSTCEVISWLRHYGQDHTVLAGRVAVAITAIDEDGHFSFRAGGRLIESRKITGYWYRRGSLTYEAFEPANTDCRADLLRLLHRNYDIEMGRIIQYFHAKLREVNAIGSLQRSEVNKLHVLNLCRRLGIRTPRSILTTQRSELARFLATTDGVITKPATKTVFDGNEGAHICAFTEALYAADLPGLPAEFAPSYFQELIVKRYELRTVYLAGQLYSMAIFSQRNPRTAVDFRHYDRKVPNRRVPYTLPADYAGQLIALIEKLSLDCCSVDTLLGTDGKYYFLEVNPVGQFGMTSVPCNYRLEQRIAQTLTKTPAHA